MKKKQIIFSCKSKIGQKWYHLRLLSTWAKPVTSTLRRLTKTLAPLFIWTATPVATVLRPLLYWPFQMVTVEVSSTKSVKIGSFWSKKRRKNLKHFLETFWDGKKFGWDHAKATTVASFCRVSDKQWALLEAVHWLAVPVFKHTLDVFVWMHRQN